MGFFRVQTTPTGLPVDLFLSMLPLRQRHGRCPLLHRQRGHLLGARRLDSEAPQHRAEARRWGHL